MMDTFEKKPEVNSSKYYGAATDAEFEEVIKEVGKTETALIPLHDIQLIRHPLTAVMENLKTHEKISKIEEELKLDKELGLQNQAALTSSASLRCDIDELTKSNDYFEVTPRLLRKLFQIGRLRYLCLQNTISMFFKALFSEAWPAFLATALAFGLVSLNIFTWVQNTHIKSSSVFTFVAFANVVFSCGLIAFCCHAGWIWYRKLRKLEWPVFSVKLNMVPLVQVNDKIPYGVKLKILEARKSGIFEDFVYTKPEFKIDQRYIKIESFVAKLKDLFTRIRTDPAIVGITRDKRMFMIVYWDVKHDVEKIIKNIRMFRKLKISV